MSPSSLALVVAGQRRDLQAAEINTIRQRRGDSLANGAKWGFGVGASLGFVTAMAIAKEEGVGDDAAIVARRAASAHRLTVRPVLTRQRQGAMVVIGF